MTVSTTHISTSLVANGVSRTYNFDFQAIESDQIHGYEDGIEGTPDRIIINTDQVANPGGTFEFLAVPVLNSTILIQRETVIDQLTEYQLGGNFPSESHEQALDKLTMVSQESNAKPDIELAARLRFLMYPAVFLSSGSSHTFDSIPSWAKRITVMMEGLNITLDNTDVWLKLGDAAGIESVGYEAISSVIAPAGVTNNFASTTHWVIYDNASQFSRFLGNARIMNITGNRWIMDANMADIDDTPNMITAGSKTLSDVLTSLTIGLSIGSFTAGYVNILVEG